MLSSFSSCYESMPVPCWYALCGFCSVEQCHFMHGTYSWLLSIGDQQHFPGSHPASLPTCPKHGSLDFSSSDEFRWWEYRTVRAGECCACRSDRRRASRSRQLRPATRTLRSYGYSDPDDDDDDMGSGYGLAYAPSDDDDDDDDDDDLDNADDEEDNEEEKDEGAEEGEREGEAAAAYTSVLPVPLHATVFRALSSQHFSQLINAAMGEPAQGRDVFVLMNEEAALSRVRSRQYGHVVLQGTAAQVQRGRRALGMLMDEGYQHSPLYATLCRMAAAMDISCLMLTAGTGDGESDMDESEADDQEADDGDDSGAANDAGEERSESERVRTNLETLEALAAATELPTVRRFRWRDGGGRYQIE